MSYSFEQVVGHSHNATTALTVGGVVMAFYNAGMFYLIERLSARAEGTQVEASLDQAGLDLGQVTDRALDLCVGGAGVSVLAAFAGFAATMGLSGVARMRQQ